jgi:hypothetical protein
VCGGGHHICKFKGWWNHAGCHQPTDMCHISKQDSLLLVTNLYSIKLQSIRVPENLLHITLTFLLSSFAFLNCQNNLYKCMHCVCAPDFISMPTLLSLKREKRGVSDLNSYLPHTSIVIKAWISTSTCNNKLRSE